MSETLETRVFCKIGHKQNFLDSIVKLDGKEFEGGLFREEASERVKAKQELSDIN